MIKILLFLWWGVNSLSVISTTEIKHIYIINLKNRIDKRKICDLQMRLLGVDSYKYIEAFNGKHFMNRTLETLARASGLSDVKIDRNRVPKNGESPLGCLITHMKVFRQIIDSNITDPVLILEDDFLADGNAFKDLPELINALPSDWGLFYPGHCDTQTTCSTFIDKSRRICKSKSYVTCTQSFIVNGVKSARILYDAANKPDFQFADMYAQATSLNRYVLFPSIFTQLKQYFKIKPDINSSGGFWPPLANTTIAEILKKELAVA